MSRREIRKDHKSEYDTIRGVQEKSIRSILSILRKKKHSNSVEISKEEFPESRYLEMGKYEVIELGNEQQVHRDGEKISLIRVLDNRTEGGKHNPKQIVWNQPTEPPKKTGTEGIYTS